MSQGVGPKRTNIHGFHGWANEEQTQTSQGEPWVSELLHISKGWVTQKICLAVSHARSLSP
jgi:hypothetical protein